MVERKLKRSNAKSIFKPLNYNDEIIKVMLDAAFVKLDFPNFVINDLNNFCFLKITSRPMHLLF